jgi:hypothetical protein
LDLKQLKERLDSEGVKPVYYVLNGSPYEGALRLSVWCGTWFIEYCERGLEQLIEKFETEDAACLALYRMLRNDTVIMSDRSPRVSK